MEAATRLGLGVREDGAVWMATVWRSDAAAALSARALVAERVESSRRRVLQGKKKGGGATVIILNTLHAQLHVLQLLYNLTCHKHFI